ncbi:MAG: class I SAM-dependent methyltransferase [Terriglobales bacterium]
MLGVPLKSPVKDEVQASESLKARTGSIYNCTFVATTSKLGTLRSVSDTALLVAYHRAMETRRADALFRDDIAVRLSEGRGEQIARKLAWGRAMAWSTIVRTVLLDDIVLRLVGQGVDTVVNLAAGLDARPYRLPLPSSLRWIEVDLPDLLRGKNDALAGDTPVCRLDRVPLDLADAAQRRELFARVGAESRHTLIMSEGLLVYLPPGLVHELADDLHAQSSFRHWAFDLATPVIKQRINRWWGRKLKAAQTQYQFAPDEGTRFFLPHGWDETEFHVLFEHSVRLNRTMRGMWILDLMNRLAPRRAPRMAAKWRAGIVLLERTPLAQISGNK